MARRKIVNSSDIKTRPGVQQNDLWIMFVCLNCGEVNVIDIGEKLLTPEQAYKSQKWECRKCHYIHSKDSDLPENWQKFWDSQLLSGMSLTAQRFWQAFFRNATDDPEHYWKQCKICGRVLPATDFAKHSGPTSQWSELHKQRECKACKAAINAMLNKKRTSEQLREASAKRRLGDLLARTGIDEDDSKLDIAEIFRRFDSKCFKTGKPLDINDRQSWHIDHILPSRYWYPLTMDNACLLSSDANESKNDTWPSQFYTPQELVRLSEITGAPLKLLTSPEPVYNTDVDANLMVDKYLDIRNTTDLSKRVNELRKMIESNGLIDKLTEKNKHRLGFQ